MNALVLKLLKYFVGKNIPHLARKIQTFVGGILIGSVVLVPSAVDPTLIEGAGPDVVLPSAEEVASLDPGNLTFGETIRLIMGMIMIWASRIMSWLRSRNRDWIADWFGLFVGRSLDSLGRAALTGMAGVMAWLSAQNFDPADLENAPLSSLFVALLGWMLASWSSSTQDRSLNPVESSPERNLPTIFAALANVEPPAPAKTKPARKRAAPPRERTTSTRKR